MSITSDDALLEGLAQCVAGGEPCDVGELVALLARLETRGRWPRYLRRILRETAPKLRDSAEARRQFADAARAFVALRRYAGSEAA